MQRGGPGEPVGGFAWADEARSKGVIWLMRAMHGLQAPQYQVQSDGMHVLKATTNSKEHSTRNAHSQSLQCVALSRRFWEVVERQVSQKQSCPQLQAPAAQLHLSPQQVGMVGCFGRAVETIVGWTRYTSKVISTVAPTFLACRHCYGPVNK